MYLLCGFKHHMPMYVQYYYYKYTVYICTKWLASASAQYLQLKATHFQERSPNKQPSTTNVKHVNMIQCVCSHFVVHSKNHHTFAQAQPLQHPQLWKHLNDWMLCTA